MKTLLLSLSLCFIFSFSYGQTTHTEKGIILSIEDDKVYLDLNISNVSVGTKLQVIEDRGFFTHPVTGEKIAREPEIIAYIQILEVKSNYSVGSVSPRGSISKLSAGMEAYFLDEGAEEKREFRKSIAVQPMNVSSARGGYLGFYIADLLTEELFNIDKFTVIDRQTLGMQMDEIALTSRGVIDERETIQLGRTRGVDYFITGTVYEPDVVETGTGIPVKGIIQAAETISGHRLGSELVSDVNFSQLRAIVNITLRVVDVQTGEILFIASEMQEATGRSQITLEQGALGGLQLQGGATSFLNTITGQATKKALVNLADYIDSYFEGEIDVRNFRGNFIDISREGSRNQRRIKDNANIVYAEVMDYNNSDQQTFIVNINKGSSAGYLLNHSYPVYETIYEQSKINNETIETGKRRFGKVKIIHLENDNSQGQLLLKKGIKKPIDYDFRNTEVKFVRNRRLIIEPLYISGIDYYPNFSIGGNVLSASYRITNSFQIGINFSSIVEIGQFVGLTTAYNYQINKTFEFYTMVGLLKYLYEDEYDHNLPPIIFRPGMQMYMTHWLSFNLRLTVLPSPAIGGGFNIHLF